ncbi:3-oxoacyl-[acyl-carrier-protein] reductase [Paramaledivibacter caminithermalis]|jgi:3-oxoacyl-[acyl-carrier protein] reductase|uniref:3-oxoacyl-[acyl-carrier-protein] reductase n=1 Tax=Paramaledivibacter caminithermalis (strain DSM 15212 / CIP 107654 / DViRD3) TaxID=1121301 RepID=A0A1M6NJH6_PARC5|nr:3-oxoacyl-[acyl-carrier-protein] reductase [Paramaledivibacter caminithermalis]SHJ95702.1 3-oxoacyl-[acyl-carrier-protein] reductase [Paramaledivibacter caminithermalis DSM 15212]
MNLSGKTAIITGGSRGIGKAIAIKLAEKGANIVVNYTSNSNKAEEVVEEIKKMGREALAIKADVSNSEDVKNLVKEVEKNFSSIDILINNAGITRDTLLIRMKDDDWDKVMDVNLKGTFLCTKLVGKKMMKQRSGKIVNITSVVGIIGNAGQTNYSASKAGVIGFTKSSAKELASRGVNVNAVAPGFIETDMTEKLSEEVVKNYSKSIPLGKMGKPEDVANVVAFLCSEESDYLTGQVINVDGGMVM